MNKKQTLSTGDESNAMQVAGDVIIGSSYIEIKEIFQDLFDLNFPKLQQIAYRDANNRVLDFLQVFKSFLESPKNNIDPLKFMSPEVQFEMQAIALNVAKKGEKSNMELLSELLCNITSKDCPELFELMSAEALKVVPLMNRKHIGYLSVFLFESEIQFNNNDIEVINDELGELRNSCLDVTGLTFGDLGYLSSIGVTESRSPITIGMKPMFISKIPELKDKKIEEIGKYCTQNHFEHIEYILRVFNQGVGFFRLKSIGRLIGWMNIAEHTKTDIKEHFR